MSQRRTNGKSWTSSPNSPANNTAKGRTTPIRSRRRRRGRNRSASGGQSFFTTETRDETSSIGTIDSYESNNQHALDGFDVPTWDAFQQIQDHSGNDDRGARDARPSIKPVQTPPVLKPPSQPNTPEQTSFKPPLLSPPSGPLNANLPPQTRCGSRDDRRGSGSQVSGVGTNTGIPVVLTTLDTAPPFAAPPATAAEVIVGGITIRVRLIDQASHGIVDPTFEKTQSKKAPGSKDDRWFKDNKRRIMWVLNVNDSNYNIVLTHSQMSGKKTLTVNGVR